MFDVDVDVDHIMKELLIIVLNTFAPAENNQAQTSTQEIDGTDTRRVWKRIRPSRTPASEKLTLGII